MKPAIFEDLTTRTEFLPFFRPDIGEEEITEVVDTLRSGWITTGPKVKQFEQEFAVYTGARHAVAVSSCTAAMHVTLAAWGIGPGDEVITTPMTFCGTIEAIEYLGAKPVLVDVDPATQNIEPEQIEAAVTAKTRAILPVHYAGRPCEMDRIMGIADRHGLHVLEDAAHAVGASYHGQPIGVIGHATAFSFYANKNMTTAEGGMITTNDEALAEKLRILTLHGISRDAWKRYSAEGTWYYEVLELGFKYNLTDIQAALGLWQLRKLDRMNRIRATYADFYTAAFRETQEVTTPSPASESITHAWHLYPIELNLGLLSIDRAEFMRRLHAENIGASVHFIPVHLHPHYQKTFGFRPGQFPQAERFYERAVSLPLYSQMTPTDAQDVVSAIVRITKEFQR